MPPPVPTADKVLSLENLAHVLEGRTQGQRIVLCHGDFEVLHPGYIHYLEEARRMGDVLVVTLTPDRHLPQTLTYPHFDGPQRAQSLAALSMVDFVVVNAVFDTAVFDLKAIVHAQRLKYAAQRRNRSAVFRALDLP